MRIIRNRLPIRAAGLVPVDLFADRATLQKTRWRGVAEDGTEFGFDLQEPLRHGDPVYATGEALYVITQRPEDVLEIAGALTPKQVALLTWSIGNLHQPIEILQGCIRVPDDPAARTLLDHLQIPFSRVEAVFQPQTGPVRSHHHQLEHAHHH